MKMTVDSFWSRPAAEVSRRHMDAARQRQQRLTKPRGSLGELERLAVRFAGWQATVSPRLDCIAIRVFVADHGVARRGVSAFPESVTGEMIRNFVAGGAAIAVLARLHDADFTVVNVGVAGEAAESLDEDPRLVNLQIANGSADLSERPAMTESQLHRCLQAGADQVPDSAELFIGGEMGIGNTTSAAALMSAYCSLPPALTAGRGTGIDDETFERKIRLIDQALALHRERAGSAFADPLEILRRLGGLEVAALTGAYIRCAQSGVPALVDGFIASVAALAAIKINPGVEDWLLFAHCSAESAHPILLEELGAKPLLNLGMRLGEASGAALAVPVLRSALELHNGMATFEEAVVATGR